MTPQNLNIRQTIEGMLLTFDGDAAGGLTAVIRINQPLSGSIIWRMPTNFCPTSPRFNQRQSVQL